MNLLVLLLLLGGGNNNGNSNNKCCDNNCDKNNCGCEDDRCNLVEPRLDSCMDVRPFMTFQGGTCGCEEKS